MEAFIESFNGILDIINSFLYGKFLIIVLLGVGSYFTIRTRFVQVRLFPEALRVVTEKSQEKDGLSSFQALMISTASRVGTGNIAGVATAIVAGGVGAVVWMWIIAIIGAASAFIESTLAQVYKQKDGAIFKGGPAYYIERAMKCRWLGVVFAIVLILTYAFGFNGLQAQTIASAFKYYIPNFDGSMAPIIIGIILAALSAVIFFGGGQRIGKISSVLVPIMAFIYIALGLVVFFANIGSVPEAFATMFKEAFDFRAIFGGFAGSCVVQGIKRGLFSNEAGMGSAPNAAAAADVSHPAKQGLVQVLSVFIDTIIICSTTAFTVILTEQFTIGGDLDGAPLVQQSVATIFGEFGIMIITLCLFLFAFTSVIGNYFYAEANIKFINESKTLMTVFRCLAVIMIFVGAQLDLATAWGVADVLMGVMTTINCIAMLALGGIAIKVLKDYEEQKSKGLNPVFKAEKLGIHDTDCWK
ncbi:MAG: alanine/glycine:cation symporter family protein [Anaerovoracaceae bacterium]